MCQKNEYTRRTITVLLAVVTALFAFGAMQVDAQVAQGGTYKVEQSLIASGGATNSTGGTYALVGAIGEPFAGTTSGAAAFSVKGGFLSDSGFAPTAAAVSISGRVSNTDGGGLVNAFVTLTDLNGNARTVLTKKFGNFRFDDVTAGEAYIITVTSRRYTFEPRVVNALENISDVNFTASPTTTIGLD